MKKFLLLLAAFFLASVAVFVAELAAADAPSQAITECPPGDQFDADFADDFDADFAGECNVSEILINDPLEPFNRGVFWVNDKLYFYLLKPVAKGYRLVLPRQARISVNNVFVNASTPVRAANNLLQFKFHNFATELYRLIINSTIGLGGLFDPAAALTGVEKVDDEDFGQTLGSYGAGHGFYLVLPIIGPSSLRDATGRVVDSFAEPIRHADLRDLEYFGVKLFQAVNSLSLDRDTYEGIVRDSLDPYLFVRAAYAQRRVAQIGKVDYGIFSTDGTFLDDILPRDGSFLDTDILNPFDW